MRVATAGIRSPLVEGSSAALEDHDAGNRTQAGGMLPASVSLPVPRVLLGDEIRTAVLRGSYGLGDSRAVGRVVGSSVGLHLLACGLLNDVPIVDRRSVRRLVRHRYRQHGDGDGEQQFAKHNAPPSSLVHSDLGLTKPELLGESPGRYPNHRSGCPTVAYALRLILRAQVGARSFGQQFGRWSVNRLRFFCSHLRNPFADEKDLI